MPSASNALIAVSKIEQTSIASYGKSSGTIQWTVVDHLLGLSTDEPYSDDYLADQIVPAILKVFTEIQA